MLWIEKYAKLILIFLVISLVLNGVLATNIYRKNAQNINIQYVDPEQIGLNIQSEYQVNNEVPEVHIKWSWTKSLSVMTGPNIQDIVAVSWDNNKDWISATEEGGGGPGMSVIEQLKLKQGLSYLGQPRGKDGEITFKLSPVPPDSHPNVPPKVTISFIHPQQRISGAWTDNTIQYSITQK